MLNGLKDLLGDLHLPKAPFWMVAGAIVLVVLTWVPLAIIARARVTLFGEPRPHLFQDMDSQPKYDAQDYTLLFQDNRAMRPPVPGTVARGELGDNPAYYNGYVVEGGEVRYVDTIPAAVEVNEALLLRGQDMYAVYCFPCHGLNAKGEGPVHVRAARLLAGGAGAGTTWVPPSNLLMVTEEGPLQYGPELYPDGKLYNVITNGIRNMPAYGDQVRVHDRWAIVAYIRALQTAQAAPPGAGPVAEAGAQ